MSQAQGVESLKKAVVAVAEVGTLAGDVLEDGRVTLWELPKLAGLGEPVSAILALPGLKLVDELSDLTQVEVDALVAAFKAKFDLPSESAELAAEEGVELALRWADLLSDTVKYGKRLAPVAVPAEAV